MAELLHSDDEFDHDNLVETSNTQKVICRFLYVYLFKLTLSCSITLEN